MGGASSATTGVPAARLTCRGERELGGAAREREHAGRRALCVGAQGSRRRPAAEKGWSVEGRPGPQGSVSRALSARLRDRALSPAALGGTLKTTCAFWTVPQAAVWGVHQRGARWRLGPARGQGRCGGVDAGQSNKGNGGWVHSEGI